MQITFECTDCNGAIRVKAIAPSRRIRCPHCEQITAIPDNVTAAEDDELRVPVSQPSRKRVLAIEVPENSDEDDERDGEHRRETGDAVRSGTPAFAKRIAITAVAALVALLFLLLNSQPEYQATEWPPRPVALNPLYEPARDDKPRAGGTVKGQITGPKALGGYSEVNSMTGTIILLGGKRETVPVEYVKGKIPDLISIRASDHFTKICTCDFVAGPLPDRPELRGTRFVLQVRADISYASNLRWLKGQRVFEPRAGEMSYTHSYQFYSERDEVEYEIRMATWRSECQTIVDENERQRSEFHQRRRAVYRNAVLVFFALLGGAAVLAIVLRRRGRAREV